MRLRYILLLSVISLTSTAQDALEQTTPKQEYQRQALSLTEFQRKNIKSISVVAPEWQGYTHKDGSGLYWDIMRAIYEPQGIKVKTRIVPWNRAIKMVSIYRTYNAIVGEYSDSAEAVIFPKYPIDVEYMVTLSKNSFAHTWKDATSLTHKRVAWFKDYELIDPKDRDFELLEFRTLKEGIEMLKSGKVDFIVNDRDSTEQAMRTQGLSEREFTLNEMPFGRDIFTAFSDDILSRELINIYNERIPKLVASGKLAAIYEKWNSGEMPKALSELTELAQQ